MAENNNIDNEEIPIETWLCTNCGWTSNSIKPEWIEMPCECCTAPVCPKCDSVFVENSYTYIINEKIKNEIK